MAAILLAVVILLAAAGPLADFPMMLHALLFNPFIALPLLILVLRAVPPDRP